MQTLSHVHPRWVQGFEPYGGTPDYSSTNQLNCRTTGFYDDLESLGFAWLNMLTGDLPWDIMKELGDPSAPWPSGQSLEFRLQI